MAQWTFSKINSKGNRRKDIWHHTFLCRRHDYVTALAGGKTKRKLRWPIQTSTDIWKAVGAKTCATNVLTRTYALTRSLPINSSLKYRLVVMLGARIDIVQAPIWNFIAYLLPLPDKKTTTVVKRDKTNGLDRNDRQKCSRLQRTLLIRKGSIKYCLLLLWARLNISYASHYDVVYKIMSVCMCIKQQKLTIYMLNHM